MGPIISRGSKIPAKSRSVFRLVAGKSFERWQLRSVRGLSYLPQNPMTDPVPFGRYFPSSGLEMTLRTWHFQLTPVTFHIIDQIFFLILSLTLASLVSHFLSLNPPSAMQLTVLLYKSATSLDEAPPPTKS